jgi:hypothetical protein
MQSRWLILSLLFLLIAGALTLGLTLGLRKTSPLQPATVQVTVPCGMESPMCEEDYIVLLFRVPTSVGDTPALVARANTPANPTESRYIMEPYTLPMVLEPGQSTPSIGNALYLLGVTASDTANIDELTPADVYPDALLQPTAVYPTMGSGVFGNRLFGITLVNDTETPLRFCLMDGAEVDIAAEAAQTYFMPAPTNVFVRRASNDDPLSLFAVEIKTMDGTKRAVVMLLTTYSNASFLEGGNVRKYTLPETALAPPDEHTITFADGDDGHYTFQALNGDAFTVAVVPGQTSPPRAEVSSAVEAFVTATLTVSAVASSPSTPLAPEMYNYEELAWIKSAFQVVE